jgi:hypothetical protein
MRELTNDEMELVAGGRSRSGGGGGGKPTSNKAPTTNQRTKVNMDGSKRNVTNVPKAPRETTKVDTWSCTVTVSKTPSVSCTIGNSW